MQNELSLQERHRVSLENLVFFHELCKQERIKYFLAYGTLLGCVRDNGFIPWDDDVDVWMPRSDYEKLEKIFINHNNQIGHYKLCTKRLTEKYYYGISRISDQRYKYIDDKDKNYPDMGTFIDIYPLDYVEDNESFKILYNQIYKINRKYSVYTGSKSASKIKNSIKTPLHFVARLIHGSNYAVRVEEKIHALISMEKKRSSEKKVAVPVWFTTGQQVFPVDWFESSTLHQFENQEFCVPIGYDDILKKIYGDYMTPPPLKERTQYHNYMIVAREEK